MAAITKETRDLIQVCVKEREYSFDVAIRVGVDLDITGDSRHRHTTFHLPVNIPTAETKQHRNRFITS